MKGAQGVEEESRWAGGMICHSTTGCSMRRLSPFLSLFVLALLVSGAQAQQGKCPEATALKQRKAGDTIGHFLSASISWTHVKGNTVMFEVISAWRRKHYWPCKSTEGFSGKDGWPGVGDMLTIVGLSPITSDQPRQEDLGAVSTKLFPGNSVWHLAAIISNPRCFPFSC